MKKTFRTLKKISLYVAFFGLILFSYNTVNGQDIKIPTGEGFYYGNEYEADGQVVETDLAKVIKTDSIDSDKETPLLYKIRQYFRLTGETYDNETPATSYITMIMNMALGLTSFVSLILVIFAFYLIFFDKGEAGVEKAKKILIGVAIALVLMGLSWIIVSFFFDLYTIEASRNI